MFNHVHSYRGLANLVMLVHFAFIAFAAFGGLAVAVWPAVVWPHGATLLYIALIAMFGWTCPLTPWEARLRSKAGQAARETDFVEHFIMPVFYPRFLFPAGYPRHAFIWLCLLVLCLNGAIYTTTGTLL